MLFRPPLGIVIGIGRRGAGIALGRQHRVRIGQAAVGQRAGLERVFDIVGLCVDDIAVVDDGEPGHERAAGHAVAAHVVQAIRAIGLQVFVVRGRFTGASGLLNSGLVCEV